MMRGSGKCYLNGDLSKAELCMPAVLVLWEAEAGGLQVQARPR